MGRKKKGWSMSVGERGQGNLVRVYEARQGGTLMRSIYHNGKENRKSLGHKDRRLAIKQAHELSARLLGEEQAIEQASLTLGMLMRLYLQSPAHGDKKPRGQVDDARKLERVITFWGAERRVDTLTESDVRRYTAARRKGEKSLIRIEVGRAVRDRSVQADLVAVYTALRWAERERDHYGRRLIQENPLRGIPLPRERNPVRPVATHDEYLKVLEAAGEVNPLVRLALVVAEATGRRISAIAQMRWENVDLASGIILWPEDTDKKGYRQEMPMADHVKAELAAARKSRRIGDAWVFPSPKDSTKPCSKRLLDGWLRRAYECAGVEPQKGGLWHPYRRKWATERKDYPVVDVAAAGGWKDLRTVQNVYQQADPETIRKVVLEPTQRL